MRILIAHSFYRIPGGEDRYVRQQVDLLRRSHEVRLEERGNSELEAGPMTAAGMVRHVRERTGLRRAVREFRPDIVHVHNPYPSLGPEVHLAAHAVGVPLVATAHNFRLRCPNGLTFTEGAPCTRCVGGRYDQAVRHACFPTLSQRAVYASALWIHRFILRLEEQVDLHVAPSRFVQRRLVEWGIPVERTMVVRNFTVPPAVAPPLGDRGLYLGRLSAEKGVSTLLEALRLAGDPPFEIVGGGPQEDSLRADAASLGLRRVRFAGAIAAAEVPAAIAEARFLVIPSVWDENAPLAALEAMGAGRPVVASDAGGLPELVADGRGVLVPPGNATALANVIEAYTQDVGAAAAAGNQARAFVMAESSPDAHLAGLEAAYAAAIESRRRPR